MTLAQSEQAFLEVAHLDTGDARQQAARGAYDPDYLSYTLGKLQIRALRDDFSNPVSANEPCFAIGALHQTMRTIIHPLVNTEAGYAEVP